MATSPRRTVITGIGVITPLGSTLDAYWSGLRAGRSAIQPIQSVDASPLPSRIAAEVPGFDAKKALDPKFNGLPAESCLPPAALKAAGRALRMMSRTVQMGLCAAQFAYADGRLKIGQIEPTRFGVEFGSGMIATELNDIAAAAKVSTNCVPGSVSTAVWGEQGLPQIEPTWMLKYLPNMSACHVSILFDAQGPNNSITSSDAASLLALGEAYRVIARDAADFFLVGGADSKMNSLSLCRHNLFMPLSRRNDSPEKALRPFDRDRDGTVLGEGAAVFALEELTHAQRRQARIYAEVCGFGSAFDRGCTGAGIARAARVALSEAGITPADLDHVNVHGLGTVDGDPWEARGLAELLSGTNVPVWAVKSAIGHLNAACGAVELAATLLALHHGEVPPTLNHDTPDPACPVTVTRELRPLRKPFALSLNMTDLGQCAVIVVRRWD